MFLLAIAFYDFCHYICALLSLTAASGKSPAKAFPGILALPALRLRAIALTNRAAATYGLGAITQTQAHVMLRVFARAVICLPTSCDCPKPHGQ